MKLVGVYNKSVILTFVGIVFALVGLFNITEYKIVLICLIVSGICDLFDGVVARKCKRTEVEKKFGIEIDSLCDVISFLILPSYFLYVHCQYNKFMVGIVCILYVLAGLERLGWFNVTTEGKTVFYSGLPVTYIALILPIVYLVFFKTVCLSLGLIMSFLIVAFLFVWNVPIKKPIGKWYIFFGVLAIIVSVLLVIL